MNTSIITSDILGSVDDFDIFNARSFTVLDKVEFKETLVGLAKRVDLLSQKIYNNYNYISLLILLNKQMDNLKSKDKKLYIDENDLILLNSKITSKTC